MAGVEPVRDGLADELRAAYEAVAALRCEAAERARWRARLIAITHLAKRDTGRARGRLARFRAELDAREQGPDAGND